MRMNDAIRESGGLMYPLLHKATKHASQAGRYARATGWLIRDFLSFARWRSLAVLASGGGQVATKYAAVAVVYFLVAFISDRQKLDFFLMDRLPADDRIIYVVGLVLGLGLLTSSNLLRYLVRRGAIRLGRDYEVWCVRRIFAGASHLPDSRAPAASKSFLSEGMHLYGFYARQCGMAARQIVGCLPSTVSLFIGASVLLWLDAGLTILVAGLSLAAVVAQYPANNRSAKTSERWEMSRRPAQLHVLRGFERLQDAPLFLRPRDPLLNTFFTDPRWVANLDAFSARALYGEQVTLTSRVGSSVILGVLLLLLGLDLLAGQRTWAEVAVFLGAAKFVLGDFIQVSKLLSSATRFHAQVERLQAFLAASSRLVRRPGPATAQASADISLNVPHLHEGEAAHLSVPAGTRLALLQPRLGVASPAAMVFGAIAEGQASAGAGPIRISAELFEPQAPLRPLLMVSEEVTEEALLAEIRPFLTEEPDAVLFASGWLDRPWSGDHGRRAGLPVLLALKLVIAVRRDPSFLVIDAALLNAVDERWRAAAAGRLGSTRLIVAARDLGQLGRNGETVLLIGHAQKIVAWVAMTDGTVPPESLAMLDDGQALGRLAGDHDEDADAMIE
jgi:hypothetical protein